MTDCLLDNIEDFKEMFSPEIEKYKQLLKDNDVIFHGDIIAEFFSRIRGKIIVELTMKFGCSYTDCLEILDDNYLRELIK